MIVWVYPCLVGTVTRSTRMVVHLSNAVRNIVNYTKKTNVLIKMYTNGYTYQVCILYQRTYVKRDTRIYYVHSVRIVRFVRYV